MVWPYRDLSNSKSQVLGLASCSRPAGQGPKLPQNWPPNFPVCVAMPACKGRGGGTPGHPPGTQEKLPKNCPKLMNCYKGPDTRMDCFNGNHLAVLWDQFLNFIRIGNRSFWGSGRPRGPRRPFQTVGGFAPHLLEGSPGPRGPPRPPK